MRIIKEQTAKYKYVFEFLFEEDVLSFCRSLRDRLGQKSFSFHDGKWRFNDLKAIDIIKERYQRAIIDLSLQSDMESYELEKQQRELRERKALALKSTYETDFFVKNVRGSLYPYQKIAIEFFLNNRGRAILADTMGLGKTASSLSYIAHCEFKKSLIICPSSVKYAWESETEKWTKLKACVIDGQTDLTTEMFAAYDLFIINFDLLKRFFDVLRIVRFDCIVIDEFHYIKNPTSQRTKLARALALTTPSVLLLSGTPLLNRPVELFTGLQIIDPVTWTDWLHFTIRYCQGHRGRFGWDAKGASNIEELKQRISPYFLRRTKEEVLKELPPKTFNDIPVKLDPLALKQYQMIERDFVKYLKEVRGKSTGEIKTSLMAEKLVQLNELRKVTTWGKIKIAEELIKELVDSGEKVIVFSVYNDPLEHLQKIIGKDKSVLLTGKVATEDRREMIDRFQNDESVRVFFGGMKAAGVGITLTKASNVVFLDYSWVPADHDQAVDRAHRIGQTASNINVYQLFAMNTIDQYMKDMLHGKKAIFNILIEGTEDEVQTSILNGLLKMMSSMKTT